MPYSTYDVAIIGAGAVGANLARELSRYDLRILLLDGADDVASGATRANSGIVHGGYAATAGSRKAEFCLPGNRMFDRLADELDFPFARIGSVVLAFSAEDLETLEGTRENGRRNGVSDLEICGREETLRRIPRLNPSEVRGGLFSPGAGIVSPYEFAIALAENAAANGTVIKLSSPVDGLTRNGEVIVLQAAGREYRAGFVVNAAGAGAASVAALAGKSPFAMTPRKGQYIIFRRGSAGGLHTVVFQPPTKMGKGILVAPTTWDNLLVGPDAQEIQDSQDLGTDPESLVRIFKTAGRSVSDIDPRKAIRVFSGIRPASDRKDFIIEWSTAMDGFLHLAGIESPGLTASPAIALEAVRMLKEAGLTLTEKSEFEPSRKAPIRPRPLGDPAAAAKAASLPIGNPERIVCRCEQIREEEIRDAIGRGIPLRSLDAVKRRARAGMGACQGAFCGPRVKELLAEQMGLDPEDVRDPGRERAGILADLNEMRRLLAAE